MLNRTVRGRAVRAAVAAVGAAVLLAACGGSGDDDNAAARSPDSSAVDGQSENTGDGQGADSGDSSQGPDLSDIPDPVAVVNGDEISRDEFVSVFRGQYQQMSAQSQMTGQPVDEDQLKQISVDGLVGTVLLDQEADKRGIEVSDAEIAAQLARYAETNMVSEDEFLEAMGQQGMDREAVMEQISKQLRVEKLIVDEYGEFTPTDAEVEAAYEQIAQQQAAMGGAAGQGGAAGLPPLEQVRAEVEQQLVTEQQATAMERLSQQLREGADITVNL